MKKTYYLLLFVLLASVSAKAQTGWTKQILDERVSVKFPEAPQNVATSESPVYAVKAKDSCVYIVNFVDFKVVGGLDSAALAPMKDSQEFADQLKVGMVSTMTGFTLSDVTMGKWKTYTTYNITGSQDAKKMATTIRMTLIGAKLYSLTCMVPANKVSPNKEAFFDSLEVK